MVFQSPFQKPFAKAFPQESEIAAVDWWLAGGIDPANAIAAYQPIGADSLAASYSNLANPGTFDAQEGVAPSWSSALGWTGDSFTKYLKTNIVASSGWSWIIKYSGATTINAFIFGALGSLSAARFQVAPKDNANNVVYSNGDTLVISPELTGGVLCAAGQTAYRDGVAESGSIGAWSGTGYPITILARNTSSGNVPKRFTDANIQALAIYDTVLTLGQVVSVTNAMNAL